jgi:ABC-type bacteriocin/lantibiotic exporter with double-glycine peptidase domain
MIDTRAVERAARMAQIHDFVSHDLPEGYQTAIGERGVRLSGGQRQRIGIARALYSDPEVIIFDEATSALDQATEAEVMAAIDNLTGHKTIILITHRIETVRRCHMIVRLEAGRIADIGGSSVLPQSA